MNVMKKERSKTYNYQSNNYPDASKSRPRGMSVNNSRQAGRELGVVEKLLASYGFVHPVGEGSSIFFHYSEFIGDIQTLQIGETLSFLVRTDRRSGKPVAVQLARASSVAPNSNGYNSDHVVLSYSVDGYVEMQARLPSDNGFYAGAAPVGRVSYDKDGEVFFLPYTSADVDVGQYPKKGDRVSFCIVQDKRGGTLHVKQLRVTEAFQNDQSSPDELDICPYKGVISSLKDGFGFIERSDVVSEIFFHYSQFEDDINSLEIGDDVGFEIQGRNGKDVAANVVRLPKGSVVFEDVSDETYVGEIVRLASRLKVTASPEDHLNGIIAFDYEGGTEEVKYSERDVTKASNAHVGDIVKFSICTDRRDGLQRAIDLIFEDSSVKDTQEKELGVICNIREGFGFIKCCDRDANVFFHFSELDKSYSPTPGDEVEFFVQQDDSGRFSASRIAVLPKGTVEFETFSDDVCQGTVVKEAGGLGMKSSNGKSTSEPGLIVMFEDDDDEEGVELTFRSKDCKPREFPQVDDEVEFIIATNKRNGSLSAKEISISKRNRAPRQNGFVCAIKENYGFIETADHVSDVFFHFSESTFNTNSLSLGDEVEFSVVRKNGKQCAENVTKLRSGTIPTEEILPDVYSGKVLRPLRTVDPEQSTYEGIIAKVTRRDVAMDEKKSMDKETIENESNDDAKGSNDEEEEDEEIGERFPFGITSLVDKKDPLHPGDEVTFQVGIDANDQRRATCVKCVRNVLRACVESIKGQFGFIAYDTPDGKNLFFHMSEVEAGSGTVKVGDTVEFIVIKSHKNAKQSAVKVRRVADSPKPSHLMRKRENTPIKSTFVAIRKPNGPDGTIGFKNRTEVEN